MIETRTKRRRQLFMRTLRRYAGLWVGLPEESSRLVISSGDNKEEAKSQAEMLGMTEPFLVQLSPEIKGGEHGL